MAVNGTVGFAGDVLGVDPVVAAIVAVDVTLVDVADGVVPPAGVNPVLPFPPPHAASELNSRIAVTRVAINDKDNFFLSCFIMIF
jgi:hypothetical protein